MPGEKQYFLGIPIITEQEIDAERESQDPHVYTMIRIVASDPTLGSADLKRRRLRTPCEKCREICWMDPKSFDALRGMNLTMLCERCTLKHFREEQAEQEESGD